MTNKMPEIGKRYIHKFLQKEVTCVINSFKGPVTLYFEDDDGNKIDYHLTTWDRIFEEIPQEPAQAENQDFSNPVLPEGRVCPEVHATRLEVVALTQAAVNLVNALEAEKANNKIQATDPANNKMSANCGKCPKVELSEEVKDAVIELQIEVSEDIYAKNRGWKEQLITLREAAKHLIEKLANQTRETSTVVDQKAGDLDGKNTGHYDLAAVTRLEVIDGKGRSYVNLSAKPLEFSYQDDGRTLKIFTGNKPVEPEKKIEEETCEAAPLNNSSSILPTISKMKDRLAEKFLNINRRPIYAREGQLETADMLEIVVFIEQMQKDIEELKNRGK